MLIQISETEAVWMFSYFYSSNDILPLIFSNMLTYVSQQFMILFHYYGADTSLSLQSAHCPDMTEIPLKET